MLGTLLFLVIVGPMHLQLFNLDHGVTDAWFHSISRGDYQTWGGITNKQFQFLKCKNTWRNERYGH